MQSFNGSRSYCLGPSGEWSVNLTEMIANFLVHSARHRFEFRIQLRHIVLRSNLIDMRIDRDRLQVVERH